MSADIELTILMPCLNEVLTIGRCVEKAKAYLEAHGVCGEVVVADNGSTDGSQMVASKLGARVVHISDRGYGSALIGGIRAAHGRFIVMGDSDDSYDFSALQGFLDRLRSGDDLVMGNRFLGGVMPGAMPLLHRYVGNPVLSAIGRLFFRAPCGDFHCGLRGFNRVAISRLDLRSPGMEFATEMIVKASIRGLRISEVPVKLYPDGRDRPPHLRTWRDGWRHLRFLLMFSPRWLFLYPGLLLFAFGLLFLLWLIPEPRTLGPITFDIHTLYYAALSILVGYQAAQFWVFATVHAVNQGVLPESSRFRRFISGISLEIGILAGVMLVIAGLGLGLFAVGSWTVERFGVLVPSQTFRFVIPSGTLILLGLQTIYGVFFLSILGIRAQETPALPDAGPAGAVDHSTRRA